MLPLKQLLAGQNEGKLAQNKKFGEMKMVEIFETELIMPLAFVSPLVPFIIFFEKHNFLSIITPKYLLSFTYSKLVPKK